MFGDLREPKILIGKDGMRLVDFDWSGKKGEVQYPVDVSRKIKWPEDFKGEGMIEVEHDKEWLKRITGTAVRLGQGSVQILHCTFTPRIPSS